MKLLINTSNLYVGGGIQVAISFINELRLMSDKNAYHIFLSKAIDKQIDQNNFPNNFYFYLIEKSPASLKSRKHIVKQLNGLEEKIQPDIVFSIFGPSYWRPKTRHVMGFAMPWLINPKSSAYEQLSLIQLFKSKIRQQYSKYHIIKDADFYITETADTKNKLAQVVGIKNDKIFVVGNTVNAIFYKRDQKVFEFPPKQKDEYRLLTISHNYAHKNLKVIKEVIPYLQGSTKNIRFFVTLDKEGYHSLFSGLESYVINLGPVKVNDCPSLYKQCDAMFLPTLLECFSASYPEAMKMGKPILTSNYSFATDICQDAALYFDPLDPKAIANKIIKLANDDKLQKTLVERGKKRLTSFETARSRAEKYLDICENIVKVKQNES